MAKKEEIRDYQARDLEWIIPIAAKYGEADEIEVVLTYPELYRVKWAKVIEPYALLAFFEDIHGPMVGGLTDRGGIKHLFTLCRKMADSVKGMSLHAHIEKGSWQDKLYRRFDYIKEGQDGLLWR